VAVAAAYVCAKCHLDPSNRLATIHQRQRQTDRTGQTVTDMTDKQRSDSIGRTVLQTVAQKPFLRCGNFSVFQNAILDLLCVNLGHPRTWWSFYHCAKFCWNRQCSFESMRVSLLCEFGLKMSIHAPFGGVFGL